MGADGSLNVVELQALLMGGVREYGAQAAVAPVAERALAGAAALDYVLMLVTGTANAPIPEADAQRAIQSGLVRAVDDALALLRAIGTLPGAAARVFARRGLRTLRLTCERAQIVDDERRFALIALGADLQA